jgi:hypothetical protein
MKRMNRMKKLSFGVHSESGYCYFLVVNGNLCMIF